MDSVKYKLVFSSEVIKKHGYFYSLECNNRVSSSNLKFTSRSMRIPMCLNKVSIVWGWVERESEKDRLVRTIFRYSKL